MKTLKHPFMRGNIKLHNSQHEDSIGNYAFIDIVFLTVLFCLIAMGKLTALDLVKVPNPVTTVQQINVTEDIVVITVTKDKKYYYNKHSITKLEELAPLLKKAITLPKKPTIVINCEKGLLLEDAVSLFEIFINTGILTSQIFLKVEKKSS